MPCPNCGFKMSPAIYRCGNCNAILPSPSGYLPAPSAVADVRVHPISGIGTATMAAIWIATVAWIVALAPFVRLVAGPPKDETEIIQAARFFLVGLAISLVLSGAAWLLFMTWLFLARLNVNAFPESMPLWAIAWVIAAWFVPVASVLIGPAVVADIARNSADEFGSFQRRRLAGTVWAWWCTYLLAVGLPGLILRWPAQVGFAFGYEIAGTGVFISPALICVCAGAVLGVAAAVLAGRVIVGVSGEHRQRIARSMSPTEQRTRAPGFSR